MGSWLLEDSVLVGLQVRLPEEAQLPERLLFLGWVREVRNTQEVA